MNDYPPNKIRIISTSSGRDNAPIPDITAYSPNAIALKIGTIGLT